MRVKFKYKNHKGLIEDRDVDMVSLLFDFTNHPEHGYQPGWCLGGWDYSRDRNGSEYRSFYLCNIILPPNSDRALFNYKLFELPRDAKL